MGVGGGRGNGLAGARVYMASSVSRVRLTGAKRDSARAPSVLARTHALQNLCCVKSFSQEEKKRE